MASTASRGVFLLVAWRNLWRNRRRTLLTISAIAFGVFLIQLMMAAQSGSYEPMIKLGTRMGSGHIQVLDARFKDEARIEYSVSGVQERLDQLDTFEEIESVTARAEGFALVSHDPKSTAALIVGVIPERERLVSDFPDKVVEGEYLTDETQAVIGGALSRNLDVDLGDELVLIGSNPAGGLAALILEVGGIYESTTALERVLIHIPMSTFQEAFEMPNQAHRIVAMVEDPLQLQEAHELLESLKSPDESVVDWRELMPEISQGIQIDIVSNGVLQFILALIIVLSIVNTFVMIMFERTREYGMLFAIGMKRAAVFRMSLTEAMLLWLVGAGVGVILTLIVVIPLMQVGIPIPADQAAMQDQMSFMPEAIYPDLSWWAAGVAPVVIGIGTLAAVLLTSIRLVRLNIIEALRTE